MADTVETKDSNYGGKNEEVRKKARVCRSARGIGNGGRDSLLLRKNHEAQ